MFTSPSNSRSALDFGQELLRPAAAGGREQGKGAADILRHGIHALEVLLEVRRHRRLDQPHLAGWILGLEAYAKPGFPALQHQILAGIEPFEGPHEYARPVVDREAPADHDARQRRLAVVV